MDWGLGHATRMIPLVEFLLAQNNTIVFGGNGNSLKRLSEQFPEIECEFIPGYNVKYKRKNMAIDMLLQLPKISWGLLKERTATKRLQKIHNFDLIISDNRYGVYNKKATSVFVTHQTQIKAPAFQNLINWFNHRAIKRFNECWIPDFENSPSVGDSLSHYPINGINSRYLGPLSRFWKTEKKDTTHHDILIMISGPEPNRSKFEAEILSKIISFNSNIGIISNHLAKTQFQKNGLTVYSNVEDAEFYSLISNANTFISRPGYSTVMDLLYIPTKVVFIPTKGQTEQEFLSESLKKKGWINSIHPITKSSIQEAKLFSPIQDKEKLDINKNLEQALSTF